MRCGQPESMRTSRVTIIGAAAIRRLIVAFVVANTLAVAIAWACGPFITDVPTVTAIDPADPEAFVRGGLGVLRPRFRRAYLAHAYRTFNRLPPPPAAPATFGYASGIPVSDKVWREERDRILGPAIAPASPRTPRVVDYQTPLNCLEDGYATAIRTLGARERRYGAGSQPLRDWVRAQDAVFANCDETPLSLPEPASPTADALTKADRAYQTAAAYFYGMQFEEAARRFRAIGDDAASPWRPYGRYLAARSKIRLHTLAGFIDNAPPTALADAEQELLAVIDDPIAAPLRESARGLVQFVRLRLRPEAELSTAAARIAASEPLPCCAFDDFVYLLNGKVGDTVDYQYDAVVSNGVRDTHDLVDWVLAFQGQGDQARDRAVSRWQSTKSLPWLIAALSKLRGAHPAAAALLDAASGVPSSSPAFATVNFYRVRLLIDLDRQDEARAVLATLPEDVQPGASAETINLYRGQRLMLARSFDELFRAAPRMSLGSFLNADQQSLPIFDEDAGVVFDERLPLDRLMAAAESTALPARLRARVAAAVFTRAILLNRHDRALAVAPILRTLVPELTSDLDRYVSETTDEGRRRAAILLILRTPGMTRDIRGLDDSVSLDFPEPRRTFDSWLPVWWCGPQGGERGEAKSELIHLLYQSHIVPFPSFMTADEQAAASRELSELDRAGNAARYLAMAALEWAKQRPSDPEAAEALARIVNGWRRACRDEHDAELARRSFQALHRQFPNTQWARQTKYWYR
jgi:hypothetical protein